MVMPLTVICHFRNEEVFLRYWLRHHVRLFDHGILIDYASTDASHEVIREYAPHWEVRLSRNAQFYSVAIDREVMDKINAANAGVEAIVVQDGLGGERLSVKSSTTGEAQGFRIQVSDNDGNDADNAGLSQLAFDPQNLPGVGLTAIQQSQNALFKLNGLDIASASNAVKDTIAGVTLPSGTSAYLTRRSIDSFQSLSAV